MLELGDDRHGIFYILRIGQTQTRCLGIMDDYLAVNLRIKLKL